MKTYTCCCRSVCPYYRAVAHDYRPSVLSSSTETLYASEAGDSYVSPLNHVCFSNLLSFAHGTLTVCAHLTCAVRVSLQNVILYAHEISYAALLGAPL